MWVQMFNLPLGMMNRTYCELLGMTIDEVLDVDVDKDSLGWGPFLRVRVWVDISKPLLRGNLLTIGKFQSWISFKHERLPLLYFKGGIIKHPNLDCSSGLVANKLHDYDQI